MQLSVMNSPLNEEQAGLLNRLLHTFTPLQKQWLSGYLSASAVATLPESSIGLTQAHTAEDGENAQEVIVLYGTQTGNSKGLAQKAAQALAVNGMQATVYAMNDFKLNQLKKVRHMLIIVSTHGEGEPPDNAVLFYEFLHSKRAPKLVDFQFSVLALGDSSYEFFCQTGKEIDLRLEELGGKRLCARVDCDLDFDEPANEWLDGILVSLRSTAKTDDNRSLAAVASPFLATASVYSRTNPFQAEVLDNINLNGRGSNKETRHLELSLENSGLSYEPGDSIGIFPHNDPELVAELIQELHWDPSVEVKVNKQGDVLNLQEALSSYFEITVLTKPLLTKIAELNRHERLQLLLSAEQEEQLKAYMEGRDLLDAVRDYGVWGDTPQQFVSILRRIPARLYSIASSLLANPDTVHLTIGTVRYEVNGRTRKGVCSTFCAERILPGDTLSIFVQSNDNFRLPTDPSTPIIMVGPGTGVAPFRAFMQEREEQGHSGKAWLFFGDQHFMTDFLYQTEWLRFLKDGMLTKLDVAFSRDTDRKVYVQHRMLEHSKELYAWMQEGAVLYICGDEKHMARDVHRTLCEIVQKEGQMTNDLAESYLLALQQQNRYKRDVY